MTSPQIFFSLSILVVGVFLGDYSATAQIYSVYDYVPELTQTEVTVAETRTEIADAQADLRVLRVQIAALDRTLLALFRQISRAERVAGRRQTPDLAVLFDTISDGIDAVQTAGGTIEDIEDFKAGIEDDLSDQDNSDAIDSIAEKLPALQANGLIDAATRSLLGLLLNGALAQLVQINAALGTARAILGGNDCNNNKDALDFMADANAALNTPTSQDEKNALKEARICLLRAVRVKDTSFVSIRIAHDQLSRMNRTLRRLGRAGEDLQVLSPAAFTVEGIHLQVNSKSDALSVYVRGLGIASIEVSVYDLTGRIHIQTQANGAELQVALSTDQGRLANGTYLCLVTVHSRDGKTVRTELQKLTIVF
jgi:hypothetical protein